MAEVAEKLKQHDSASSVVDLQRLSNALTAFDDEEKEEVEHISVIDSLDLPRFRFDVVHKSFAPVSKGRLFGTSADKIRFAALELCRSPGTAVL